VTNDLSQVRGIWLIHLSDGNSDAELFKKTIQGLNGDGTWGSGGDKKTIGFTSFGF
jgi:hypothetical protein